MYRLDRSAISALVATDRSRIFALDHYIEMRERLVGLRAELDHLSKDDPRATSVDARRRAGELFRAYRVAESDFLGADCDLQRYHRALDLRAFVRVGHLARAEAVAHGQAFAFVDDEPMGRDSAPMRISKGDWLRIWDHERAFPLIVGTIRPAPCGRLSIAGHALGQLAGWFEECLPAEFARSAVAGRVA